MLTLWQAEWCRASQRVRQRLTELGVDVVLRQVAAEPGEREELQRRFGGTSVPVLEVENGCVVVGSEDILAWLDEHHEPRPDAAVHRERAERSLAKRCAELAVASCALPHAAR
jgi:glutathione S-transferase